LFLIVASVIAVHSDWLGVGIATAAAERPNIILVFIDDIGWADLLCFGNQDAQTPNIDRMYQARMKPMSVLTAMCALFTLPTGGTEPMPNGGTEPMPTAVRLAL